MNIDFSQLRPMDPFGAALQGFERGRTAVKTRQAEGALQALMQDPNNSAALGALAQADPATAMRFTEYTSTRQANQLKAQQDAEEARREKILMGAKIVREINPQNDEQWQQALATAQSLGIDTSNVPQRFDPQFAQNLIATAEALAPEKEASLPSEIQLYEYAKGQGFKGTIMDWRAQNPDPIAVKNDDGTVTFYPRPTFGAPPAGAPSTAPPPPPPPGFQLDPPAEGGQTPPASGNFLGPR